MLHITNGDSTVHILQQTGLTGDLLPWRDILHEGPTPAGLSLSQMSEVRARFIADRGWSSYTEALQSFQQRDALLAQYHMHDEVLLWFEHDLYDQLQLIQILSWFSQQQTAPNKLSLICIDTFPSISHFHGLGQLDTAQLASLYPTRQEVSTQQLQLAHAAWSAYCSPDPTKITALLQQDTTPLPFLQAALKRHLEQFPSTHNGLSRTEQQILEVVTAGFSTPVSIFMAEQQREAAIFMGDSPLWHYVTMMTQGPQPLLIRNDGHPFVAPTADQEPDEAFKQQTLLVTAAGRAVLLGHEDWITLRGGIDFWRGGVHIHGSTSLWRWDTMQQKMIR